MLIMAHLKFVFLLLQCFSRQVRMLHTMVRKEPFRFKNAHEAGIQNSSVHNASGILGPSVLV